MGPLAGIAAALRLACDENYEAVLSCGVDSLGLPNNLLESLAPGPAYVESQPVIGHWPTGAVDAIETLLLSEAKHSMLAFAGAVGATAVKIAANPANINTPADLAAVEKNDGI
jgi:molybdopterin-guanine dinucleotide biosynthesis protein A